MTRYGKILGKHCVYSIIHTYVYCIKVINRAYTKQSNEARYKHPFRFRKTILKTVQNSNTINFGNSQIMILELLFCCNALNKI